MAFIYDKLELGNRGRSGSIVSINSRITPQAPNQPTSTLTQSQPAQLGMSPPSDSPFGSGSGAGANGDFNPEDVIELTCAMQSVDPKITLATLKHYYGSGGDMLLHYKLKEGVRVR
jgi:WD repeat-containing protein 48